MITTERTGSRARRHGHRVVPPRVEGLESRQLLASNATLTLTSAIPSLPPPGGTHQVAQNGFVQYTYTIAPPDTTAQAITFSDPLPADVSLLNVTSTQGTVSIVNNTATVNVGTIQPGQVGGIPVVVTIQAKPTGAVGSTFENTASILEGATTLGTASLTSTVVAAAQGTSLAVLAQANPSPVFFTPGSGASPDLNYIFTVTNTGAGTATNITVAATQVPWEVNLQTVSTTTGTALGNTFPVTIPSLAPGASVRIVATTKVKPDTNVTTLQPFIVTATTALPPLVNPIGQVAANLTPPPALPALPPPKVISLHRFGIYNQTTSILIGFSEALDPATAQNPANYLVTLAGANRLIPIQSAGYDPARRAVTLNLRRIVSIFQPIRLIVNGASSTGVANLAGTRLDGAGNGLPGSNFQRVFRGFGFGTFGAPVS